MTTAGESVTIERLTLELDHIDAQQEATDSGYVPLTPVLWSWLSIGGRDEVQFRYLLAAVRRLDQANEGLIAAERHRVASNAGADFGPTYRRHAFALIGAAYLTTTSKQPT